MGGEDRGFSPPTAGSKLNTNSVELFYLVSMPGEVKDPTLCALLSTIS